MCTYPILSLTQRTACTNTHCCSAALLSVAFHISASRAFSGLPPKSRQDRSAPSDSGDLAPDTTLVLHQYPFLLPLSPHFSEHLPLPGPSVLESSKPLPSHAQPVWSLNTWFPDGGAVWEDVGGVAFLEEVYHWVWALRFQSLLPQFRVCSSRCGPPTLSFQLLLPALFTLPSWTLTKC